MSFVFHADRTIAFARADDDSIKTLDDVIGKRVAFTSMTGSSGFIMPSAGPDPNYRCLCRLFF